MLSNWFRNALQCALLKPFLASSSISLNGLLVIGDDEAACMSQQFGGCHITVPMSYVSPRKRRLLICKLASENMSRRDIALRVGCTERRVYQILGENREKDERQASLF